MIDINKNIAIINGKFYEFAYHSELNAFNPLHNFEIDLSNTNNGKIIVGMPAGNLISKTYLYIDGSRTEFTSEGSISDIKSLLHKLENPKFLKYYDTLLKIIKQELKESFPEDYI